MVTAADVISRFNDTFNNEKELIVYGISLLPGDPNCNSEFRFNERNEPPFQIYDLAMRTHGRVYSLCSKSYIPMAQQMIDDFSNKWSQL